MIIILSMLLIRKNVLVSKIDETYKAYKQKSDIQKQIIVMYGGNCAEKVLLKDISTSASNDLEKAIDLAYLCYDKQQIG